MTTPTFQVEVPLGADPELTADRLWAGGALGLEERADTLVAGFADRAAAEGVASELQGEVQQVDDPIDIETARAAMVERTVGPFTLRAPWHSPSGDLDIVIDPGRAFGGGSHPTTRLGLRLVADNVGPGSRVADLGCGTGVLSIAAGFLGAVSVRGVDIDPVAVAVAQTNAAHNPEAQSLTFQIGSAPELAGRWDVVIVNVTIDIHEEVAPTVREAIETPVLLITGVLVGRQEARAAAAYGRPVLARITDGEWAGLVLGSPDGSPEPPS